MTSRAAAVPDSGGAGGGGAGAGGGGRGGRETALANPQATYFNGQAGYVIPSGGASAPQGQPAPAPDLPPDSPPDSPAAPALLLAPPVPPGAGVP